MTNRETTITCMRLAVTLLILMTFALAALDKWLEGEMHAFSFEDVDFVEPRRRGEGAP